MQQNKVVLQTLKKQKINYKKRKLILHAFEMLYDPLLQYADVKGEVKVEKNLHFRAELIPALRILGYELFINKDGEEFIKKI